MSKAKINAVVGRPCKYESLVQPRLQEIEQWIRDGLTDYCIAGNLGVHVASLYEYRAKFPELADTYTRARTRQVQRVVNSLFARALGEKVTVHKQKVTSKGEVIDYTEEQYIPGDVNAQKFYLVNRAPEDWKPENAVNNIHFTQNNINIESLQADVSGLIAEYQKRQALQAVSVEVIDEL